MKYLNLTLLFFVITSVNCQTNNSGNKEEGNIMKYNKLTKEEESVILNKGTERPYTGKFYKHTESGTYNCKQCDVPLYKSEDKFDAHCGWPSFDDEIENTVKRITDADGMRTEIVCANCGGHLGHVFLGESFTDKNTRHCVNSVSLTFKPYNMPSKTDTAIFASGCFWGTEHWMNKQKGVISTEVGYIGGHIKSPTYEQVCSKTSGHAEAVRVIFNPEEVSYEDLSVIFFETHDQSQINRQGHDIGDQYRSEIFYFNEKQKNIAEKLIKQLETKGYKVATKLTKASEFWKAEEYHQDYYTKNGSSPYCHFYTKKF